MYAISAPQKARPAMALQPLSPGSGGRGETGVLVCEGVSDGLLGQSSFQFVSRGAGHWPLCCVSVPVISG